MTVPMDGRSSGLALELLGRRLRDAPAGSPLRPGEDFRCALRQRLLTEVATAHAVTTIPRPRADVAVRPAARTLPARARLSRRARSLRLAVRVSVAGLAAGTVVTGVAFASEQALPGDALYGVKRAAEGVQLSLASGDTDRGLLHLEFASTRLHEVRELVASGAGTATGARVLGTLHEMDVETTDGAQLLTQAYLAKPATAQLARLVDFTRAQETTLAAVLPVLPTPAGATSLSVLRAVQVRTTQLLSTPPSGPSAPPVRPATPPVGLPSVDASPQRSVAPSEPASPTTAPASAGGSAAPATTPAGHQVTTAPVEPSGEADPSAGSQASATPSAPATSPAATTSPTAPPASVTPTPGATTSPTPASSGSPSTPPPTPGAGTSADPSSDPATTPTAPADSPQPSASSGGAAGAQEPVPGTDTAPDAPGTIVAPVSRMGAWAG